jgi:hypothetical protein
VARRLANARQLEVGGRRVHSLDPQPSTRHLGCNVPRSHSLAIGGSHPLDPVALYLFKTGWLMSGNWWSSRGGGPGGPSDRPKSRPLPVERASGPAGLHQKADMSQPALTAKQPTDHDHQSARAVRREIDGSGPLDPARATDRSAWRCSDVRFAGQDKKGRNSVLILSRIASGITGGWPHIACVDALDALQVRTIILDWSFL